MSNTPTIKKTASKQVTSKVATIKPKAKPKLETGAISKDGLWKLEAFRIEDDMWIVSGTKANLEFNGRAPKSEKEAIELMEK